MQHFCRVDSVFYGFPFVLACLINQLDKVTEIWPPAPFLNLFWAQLKTICTKNSYKICLDIFPVTLQLNQKRFHEKRPHIDTSFKQKSRVREVRVTRIYLKISETKPQLEKKKSVISMGKKYVKEQFELSHLPVFLYFNVLFRSSMKVNKK